MEQACEREIKELHRFFADWFGGRLPHAQGAFERLSAALAPGFMLVTPDGRRTAREALLAGLWQAHGAQADLSIAVERVECRAVVDDACLMLYEEWQRRGDETDARLSAAWFRRAPGAPHGVVWLHVHEVGLPVAGSSD